jgi:hypothetical protein
VISAFSNANGSNLWQLMITTDLPHLMTIRGWGRDSIHYTCNKVSVLLEHIGFDQNPINPMYMDWTCTTCIESYV